MIKHPVQCIVATILLQKKGKNRPKSSHNVITHLQSTEFYSCTRFPAKGRNTILTRCTQGVLASKFPISILRRIQGQDVPQIFKKIVQNYVTISDFATRPLKLRKPKKSQIFAKMNILILSKNENCNQRSTFPVYFLSIFNVCFIKNIFLTKNWPQK